MTTLFTLNMTFTDNTDHVFDYPSIDACLTDTGLQAIFLDGLIERCSINIGTKRITALPVMEWGRLREQLVSNSTTILRNIPDGQSNHP